MVRIKTKSIDQWLLENVISALLEDTEEMVGKENFAKSVVRGDCDLFGGRTSMGIGISLLSREVRVYGSSRFDLALKLAKLYEEKSHNEFTLIKDY